MRLLTIALLLISIPLMHSCTVSSDEGSDAAHAQVDHGDNHEADTPDSPPDDISGKGKLIDIPPGTFENNQWNYDVANITCDFTELSGTALPSTVKRYLEFDNYNSQFELQDSVEYHVQFHCCSNKVISITQ